MPSTSFPFSTALIKFVTHPPTSYDRSCEGGVHLRIVGARAQTRSRQNCCYKLF
jgi:hypothetical protein